MARPHMAGVAAPHADPPTALHLIDSATGRPVYCRSTKIIPTHSPCTTGSVLCRANIDGTGCMRGSECPMVHCISKEHVWEPIKMPDSPDPDKAYAPGWLMRTYDADLTTYMEIPSSFFLPTVGSATFIAQFNMRGEQVKQQFRICRAFRQGRCAAGYSCEDLHCTASDLSHFKCSVTHTNEEASLRRFRCLDPGFIVRVFIQNSPNEFDDFSSERVLHTVGADRYLEAYRAEGGHIPKKKMQHCAHFRMKRLCRLGAGCKFIHAVPLVHPQLDFDLGALSQSQSGAVTPRSESDLSASNDSGPRPLRSPREGERRHVRVRVRSPPNAARSINPAYATTAYFIDDGPPLEEAQQTFSAAASVGAASSQCSSASITLSPVNAPAAPPIAAPAALAPAPQTFPHVPEPSALGAGTSTIVVPVGAPPTAQHQQHPAAGGGNVGGGNGGVRVRIGGLPVSPPPPPYNAHHWPQHAPPSSSPSPPLYTSQA